MTRLLLADDSLLLRASLAHLLTDEGFEIVGEAGDAQELFQAIDATGPDAAIIDIRMPPTHTDEGLRAALALREGRPGLAVLLLSQFVETRDLMRLLNGPHGGIGYLLKDRITNIDSFIADVKRVAAGGTAVDPQVVERVLTRPRSPGNPLTALSPRQRGILALMAEGRSNSGIGTALFLTERTVETHLRSIFLRLGIEHQTDVNRRVLAVLTHFRAAASR
jgi:DNA-binding NarL/FixJ family response regulator